MLHVFERACTIIWSCLADVSINSPMITLLSGDVTLTVQPLSFTALLLTDNLNIGQNSKVKQDGPAVDIISLIVELDAITEANDSGLFSLSVTYTLQGNLQMLHLQMAAVQMLTQSFCKLIGLCG